MLFIWTNDGGPFQYIGLALFLLQVILPQVLVWLDQDIDELYYSISTPSTPRTIPSQQAHSSSPATEPDSSCQRESTTPASFGVNHSNSYDPPFPWGLVITGIFAFLMVYLSSPRVLNNTRNANNHNHNNNNNNNVPQPQGGGENSVNNDETQQPPRQHGVTCLARVISLVKRGLARFLGCDMNDPRLDSVILFLSFVPFLLVSMVYFLPIPTVSTENALQWMPIIEQSLSSIVFLLMVYQCGRGIARAARGGGAAGAFGQPTFTRQQQEVKMNRMLELVHKVPVETFVFQEELEDEDKKEKEDKTTAHQTCDYSSIPISQLKAMLQHRGIPQEEIDSFVERQNLIEKLKQCRKYSDSCCICFEPYQEGDALRVFPNCHHELHVDCLDRWVYTFANNPTKLQHEPSCPLCKESLTRTL